MARGPRRGLTRYTPDVVSSPESPAPPDNNLTSLLDRARPGVTVGERQAFAAARRRLLGRDTEPITLSRYVLVRSIGAGAGAVVYEAYDPELDRARGFTITENGVTIIAQSDGAERFLQMEKQTV